MLWKDKYALGVPLIDCQHRELFQRVDAFMQTVRFTVPWEQKAQRVNETLAFMRGYVVEHFRDEEAYQEWIGYPGFEAHRQKHRDMVQYVLDVSAEYEEKGCDEQLMQQFAGKLLAWLINHVAAEDQRIAPMPSKRGWRAMVVDLYGPFLTATRNVFQLMLDLSDVSDRPAETFVRDDALSIAIGVTGDLTGEVIYLFPCVTSINMVTIMSGMEVDSVDDFVTSAVAEVANIISGNVLTLLTENQLACDILPPELREPDDSRSYALRTATCLTTALGDVCLDIRLNPAK